MALSIEVAETATGTAAPHAFASTRKPFKTASGKAGHLYSLPALAKQFPSNNRLPVSIRIVLESVLRNCDGIKVTADHVAQLAQWQPRAPRTNEIPFVVARVVLQDFTGVPLLADLAAMRSTAVRLGKDPRQIEPLVPVDLVVDHSVMVDHYGHKGALDLNMKLEFQRNRERYQFLKWGMQAFDTFGVVPQASLPAALRSGGVTVWLGPRLDVVQYPVQRGEWLNTVVIVQGSAGWRRIGLGPCGERRRPAHGAAGRLHATCRRSVGGGGLAAVGVLRAAAGGLCRPDGGGARGLAGRCRTPDAAVSGAGRGHGD